MKKTYLAAATATMAATAILVACGGTNTTPDPVVTPPAAPFTVKVIGFNDYHGQLEAAGTFGTSTAVPAADRPPVAVPTFWRVMSQNSKSKTPTTSWWVQGISSVPRH